MTSKTSPELTMKVAVANIPKPESEGLGDDYFFFCDYRDVVGIADGVGGWKKRGVDAGQYARELMLNAEAFIQTLPIESNINLRNVLNEAFLRTKSRGSSTACIASLEKDPKDGKYSLHALNVGDSGFMVLRNNMVVFQSPIQEHEFNHPYQLGNGGDTPEKGEEFNVEVEAGDVVVFGTDGLFDNVYASEIQKCVELNCVGGNKVTPRELAWNIAKYAHKNSNDLYIETPFSEAACTIGGKIDDITVLVAYIVLVD